MKKLNLPPVSVNPSSSNPQVLVVLEYDPNICFLKNGPFRLRLIRMSNSNVQSPFLQNVPPPPGSGKFTLAPPGNPYRQTFDDTAFLLVPPHLGLHLKKFPLPSPDRP